MIKFTLSTKLGELQVSQAQLARITGIRPATIFDIYHNYAERVKVEDLSLICRELDCRLDEIAVYIPDESDEAVRLQRIQEARTKR